MKRCEDCGKIKSLDMFYKAVNTPDKHRHICIPCYRLRNQQYHSKNKIKMSQHARLYRQLNIEQCRMVNAHWEKTESGKFSHKKATHKYNRNNPEKGRAVTALHRAVKRGEIERPDYCTLCKKQTLVHGHHHDYNDIYNVTWLCSGCHSRLHRWLSELKMVAYRMDTSYEFKMR
jgi:hypothetical protein